jgi:hypothetical protein
MDIQKWLRTLPALKSEKNPTVALIVGFLFGGVGLAIYFRKVIDFFIPVFACIVLAVFHSQLRGQGELYVAAGAVIAACYGYLRARSSNEMLATGRQAPASNSFAGLARFCANCGGHLDPAAAFCPSCGTRNPQPATPSPQPADWFANTAAKPASFSPRSGSTSPWW